LIGASSTLVASSVQNIRVAGGNITDIVAGIRDVANNMSQISNSSAEQSLGLSEITTAMRQLDEITQSNAHMVDNAVTQASNLEERALTLVEAVAMFKLQQGSAEEAVAMVARAMAHRKRSASTANFLRDITNPSQGFYDRDMYIFVLDRKGTYLAFGGNPTKCGTRVQDIAGINGAGLLADIFAQAEYEPGWVEYDINNPLTGQVQSKMSYVCMLDDLAIGCGVYKNFTAS
ncbi:MAG: cache domain-containing protein, partial [Undibacterium sp.]|nr:cache domain-containing protein [Undibacterium sp.]